MCSRWSLVNQFTDSARHDDWGGKVAAAILLTAVTSWKMHLTNHLLDILTLARHFSANVGNLVAATFPRSCFHDLAVSFPLAPHPVSAVKIDSEGAEL